MRGAPVGRACASPFSQESGRRTWAVQPLTGRTSPVTSSRAGHTVRVVTMGDGEPAERPCEVEVVSRRLPFPLRYGLVALRGARAGRRADVLYATATYAAAAIAATLARRPLVAKLVSDPAYERARRYRLFSGTLEEFQGARSRPVRLLKALRTLSLQRAVTVVAPSAYLAEIADRWGLHGVAGSTS